MLEYRICPCGTKYLTTSVSSAVGCYDCRGFSKDGCEAVQQDLLEYAQRNKIDLSTIPVWDTRKSFLVEEGN